MEAFCVPYPLAAAATRVLPVKGAGVGSSSVQNGKVTNAPDWGMEGGLPSVLPLRASPILIPSPMFSWSLFRIPEVPGKWLTVTPSSRKVEIRVQSPLPAGTVLPDFG